MQLIIDFHITSSVTKWSVNSVTNPYSHHYSKCSYCIVGKLGGENAWRIYSFQAFGGIKFSEWIDQPKGY